MVLNWMALNTLAAATTRPDLTYEGRYRGGGPRLGRGPIHYSAQRIYGVVLDAWRQWRQLFARHVRWLKMFVRTIFKNNVGWKLPFRKDALLPLGLYGGGQDNALLGTDEDAEAYTAIQ